MFDVLFSGCRSGRFPLEYARQHHGDRVTVHAYDAYQARKIREDVGAKSNVAVLCADGLPDGMRYDKAFYHATDKLVSAELELDTLQDIHLHLKDGAQLVAEGVEPSVLGKLFAKVAASRASRRAPVKCVCTKAGELKRVRTFAATFEASVPGGPKLPLVSLPGCFCHRRPDEGGLALAETAAKALDETPFAAADAVPVLDIGCGCGLVGLLVSDALRRRGCRNVPLALVDSHTRAIAAARRNASALGIEAECILSDVGLPPEHPHRGRFRIALANPPYYGEGRIADLFAEIAAGALAPDGTCWMVAKTPSVIEAACAKFFRHVETFRRRGYTVLRAMKALRLLAAFAVAALCGCSEDAVKITAGNAEVVVPDAGNQVAAFAGQEMTNFLTRVFGAPVPLTSSPTSGRVSIILGTNSLSMAAGVDVAGLPADGFVRKVVRPDRIYLAGDDNSRYGPATVIRLGQNKVVQNNVRGTLNAAYDFLERFAGVRFYFPGEIGTIAPHRDVLSVPCGERRVAPAFAVRKLHMLADGAWYEGDTTNSYYYKPCPQKVLAWMRLRLQCAELPCSHGQTLFWHPERFATTHPEYFQLRKDGTRCTNVLARVADCRNRQLCHTSKVWDELYLDAKSYLSGEDASVRGIPAGPGSKTFAWGDNCSARKYVDRMPQDGFQACHCTNCQAAYGTGKHYATELIWSNTVNVANRLKAAGVPGTITQMAYPPYGDLPSMDIPDNVRVMVAENGPWSRSMPSRLEKEYGHIRAWARKSGGNVWVWTYPGKIYGRNLPDVPQMSPRAWGTYFKDLAPSIFGAFCETESDRWIFNYLNYYVFAKVAWDPDLDLDALLDEHYRLMFGAGAPQMKEIYESMERKWVDEICGTYDDTPLGPVPRPATFHEICDRIYSLKELDRLSRLYDAAIQAAGPDSKEAERIRFIRAQFFEPLSKRVAALAEAISVKRGLAERKKNAGLENLLLGGGCDSLEHWTVEWGTARAEVDTTTFVTPPASIKVVSTNTAAIRQFIDGKIVPGRRYRLSYFVKLERVKALQNWCGVFGEYFDQYTWYYFPKAEQQAGTFDWCYRDFEFVAQDGSKQAPLRGQRPWFHMMMKNVTGTAWFDDVKLESQP